MKNVNKDGLKILVTYLFQDGLKISGCFLKNVNNEDICNVL